MSRVVAQFEGTIQQLAALAALMPIVASIGGNTGNQTMALVIRALALDTVRASGARRVMVKEVTISLLNGVVWGLVIGVLAVALYARLALGAVMAFAVVLNLVVAALAGVIIPLGLHAAGRDPAHGSSVLLTPEIRDHHGRSGQHLDNTIGRRQSTGAVWQTLRVLLVSADSLDVASVRVTFLPLPMLWPLGIGLLGVSLLMAIRLESRASLAE